MMLNPSHIVLFVFVLTLFIPMDFPKHIDTIYMGKSILGHRSKFLNYDVFMSLKIVFILAYIADPDEMLP